ncbi:MAG: hypothetical protein HKN64_02245 [Woeseiaceae bacterium]|nr:hypothetical protein [Woeseiaceae bacterium]
MLTVNDISRAKVRALLANYGLEIVVQPDGEPITGSYWGEPEAGIVRTTVYARRDTPVHSLLHEACHVICMTPARRESLAVNAGGDDLEEAAVCYLQIVLADRLEDVGSERLMRDMDAWGYSFRLGSTRDWFLQDAQDARQFLINQRLLTESGEATLALRM